MRHFIWLLIFFEILIQTSSLFETDIGKYDWNIKTLGEIKDLYFSKGKRLVVLNEKTPTFGSILLNGIKSLK